MVYQLTGHFEIICNNSHANNLRILPPLLDTTILPDCLMAVTDFLQFFSLSVLDTRLDPPQDEKKRLQAIQYAGPSRWKTKEFYLYGVIFAIAVPMMFKAAMDASRGRTALETFEFYEFYEYFTNKT